MTIYELTELLRYTVTTLREVEKGRYLAPGATNRYAGQFQYVLDRIEQIAAQERTETAVQARKLRATEKKKHNYDLTTILQLVASDIVSRKEAREMLGLPDRLRDL